MGNVTHTREEEAGELYWTSEGCDPDFRPAGIPAPDWFFAINPDPDNPERKTSTEILNRAFDEDGHSALFCVIQGGGIHAGHIQRNMVNYIRSYADDFVESGNGGLVATWTAGNGDVIILGLDSSEHTRAADAVMESTDGLHGLLAAASELIPAKIMDRDLDSPVKQILGRLFAEFPRPEPRNANIQTTKTKP